MSIFVAKQQAADPFRRISQPPTPSTCSEHSLFYSGLQPRDLTKSHLTSVSLPEPDQFFEHCFAATHFKMTAADMRDMLGDLPIEAHAPRAKKQKVIEKRPGSI